MIFKQENHNHGGIGFIGVLQVLFIALKLCGVIDWGWVFVMMPFIAYTSIIIIAILLLLGVRLWAERKS